MISQLSEARAGFSSLLVVQASMSALGDSCSTNSACVSEASDLFLSRLITERPLMDFPPSQEELISPSLKIHTGWMK